MSKRGWHVQRGVFYQDGKPRVLLAADYPYFRDKREAWADRLDAMVESGFRVLTCYVPWRHHAPTDPVHGDGAYDFDGSTQPNRDLLGLLDLAQERGLHVLLKPGPFVHAELPFGGLPDYVSSHRGDTTIEPERNAFGDIMEWAPRLTARFERHPLPSPFGTTYVGYVRDWMSAFARHVLAPRAAPDGPVFALQLMNEGIYSETARADPRLFGFSASTLERYRSFLQQKYGDIENYNEQHRTQLDGWEQVEPPRRPRVLSDVCDLLAYLDWSSFQADLYLQTARLYRDFLLEAGAPHEMPVVFNFNPNSALYRDFPASNDGWYTRVNVLGAEEFVFGSTNWVGVVCYDRHALHQYMMAITAFRGPAMEQNWGFSTQYFTPYERVTPSHFETMLSIACGATGATVYTFAGTRAWRDDPNLAVEWLPPRTNDRGDATQHDYPGDAPILSTGERTPKFWTAKQVAQFLEAEGHRFVRGGPEAHVAWGIYPPYAWSGQWLRRGDPDDMIWRPPLRVVPRGAFHGLDAFVEMMLLRGIAFRQLDITHPAHEIETCRVLCVSSHEYMDAATQERLARFVEEGGCLLATDILPDRDERLRPMESPLARRVFPHREQRYHRIHGPSVLEMDGEVLGRALEVAVSVEPPEDADSLVRLGGMVVGYRRRVGKGMAMYLGVGPWRARLSGDDPIIASENQRLAWRILEKLAPKGALAPAWPEFEQGQDEEVQVWRHRCEEPADEVLFLVVRDAGGAITAVSGREDGSRSRVRVQSPTQAVHAVGLTQGRLRSAYLKGVNDLRGEGVPPSVEVADERIAAEEPCDLCVTREGDEVVVSVAHSGRNRVRVRLPWRAREARLESGERVEVTPHEAGCLVEVPDLTQGGSPCRIRLEARAALEARG